ncbi:11242_t:CDS:2 [Funneliformis geosporum]|uniref:9084_t:CDS:1 n=1 Tax=Funneliformis geosporum TaxID=1117311 RepID=A0A9W4SEH8_9GLOM|nr:11242_t:CDS:2 [Funneliformis geosporum]CAI2166646.1 9084_t:CDS:2 [Funneliformis geosporum]
MNPNHHNSKNSTNSPNQNLVSLSFETTDGQSSPSLGSEIHSQDKFTLPSNLFDINQFFTLTSENLDEVQSLNEIETSKALNDRTTSSSETRISKPSKNNSTRNSPILSTISIANASPIEPFDNFDYDTYPLSKSIFDMINETDSYNDQFPLSIVNKKPKMIQQKQDELNLNRRKSIPAVDMIVNSFNRTFMSQIDTINYDTTKSSFTANPGKVKNIKSSCSNAILCVNRHEFFHQMVARLSTLAQFIKQSFRRQDNFEDLWERLYSLLKSECQQIQKLIDLTDFKSLNFPKNLGPYSEYDIEKEAMKFIPEHVTDYKFPLKVQQDGNEGFRAVSIYLNYNYDDLTKRGKDDKEQLYEELRVRVVLEMVNRIDKNRRIFENHTEEISANGGNITTTSVYEGYFQKDTIELLSYFGLSTNAPQYASLIWQIESLNTCIDNTLMGVPQLCILANILKATIKIICPDKENRYFNAPIKCKGISKRMFHFLMYNPLFGLQFPVPPIESYYIVPLVKQCDIFFDVLSEGLTTSKTI